MSTEPRPVVRAAIGLVSGTAGLVPLVVLLATKGPGDMGAGAAVGGGIVLVLFAAAAWRAARRPARATTVERSLTGTGDERDNLVATRAAAFLGVVSLPATGIATAAVAVGAPAVPTLGVLLYLLLGVAVVSFVVISRRS